MIEIKPEDAGKKIFDMWTRKWLFIVSVERDCVNIHGIPCFIKNDGMYDGAPRFSWEETPLPELRKRPREKKKIDLWVGIKSPCMLDANENISRYETTIASVHEDDIRCHFPCNGVHKITIEVEE